MRDRGPLNHWIFYAGTSILVALIAGYFSYQSEYQLEHNKAVENIQLNQKTSASAIRSRIGALGEEIKLLSQNKQVVQFMQSPNRNIISAPNQSFEQWTNSCVDHFGFYDLLVIDTLGEVVFNVTKEQDMGTNLLSGEFSTTSLAELYRKMVVTQEPSAVDFSIYDVGNDDLAAFIGAPILYRNVVIGYIALQLPTSFVRFSNSMDVHGAKDYILTTNYVFHNNGDYIPNDSIKINIPKDNATMVERDTLFLFHPFKLENISWGIISLLPVSEIAGEVKWVKIWHKVLLSVLLAAMLSVILADRIGKHSSRLIINENDVVVVQNSWSSLIQQGTAFGSDFYFRAKNKAGIRMTLDGLEVEVLGRQIEREISGLLEFMDDDSKLNEKLKQWSKFCLDNRITISSITRLPALFIESCEDELGVPLQQRVLMSWEKVLKATSIRLIGYMKGKQKIH